MKKMGMTIVAVAACCLAACQVERTNEGATIKVNANQAENIVDQGLNHAGNAVADIGNGIETASNRGEVIARDVADGPDGNRQPDVNRQ